MADRPSFQFYPAEWRNNAKLQRCGISARGAWMDALCLLHDADEYGVLRWPIKDIAQAAKVPLALLRELAAKGVLKGADKGAGDYIYRPFHAGKHGDPVTLVAAGDGPVWYCSRFVKDEWKRHQRGKGTQFSATKQPPKATPKATPIPPYGGRQGDGPSSASSSSVKQELTDTTYPATALPESPKPDPIWGTGLAFLIRKGIPEDKARPFLGKLKQTAGDVAAAALLAEAEAQDITDPAPWLATGARNAAARKGKPSVSDDFRGKSYASTPDSDLPDSLR